MICLLNLSNLSKRNVAMVTAMQITWFSIWNQNNASWKLTMANGFLLNFSRACVICFSFSKEMNTALTALRICSISSQLQGDFRYAHFNR